MPDPIDPIFLPRINKRSRCEGDSLLGHSGCDQGPGDTPTCDKRDKKCSFFCDNVSKETNLTRHNYYDCCVQVSATKLLDHWLNDHDDSGIDGEDVIKTSTQEENCQNQSTKSTLASLRSECLVKSQNILHLLLNRSNPVRNVVELVQRILEEDRNVKTFFIDQVDNHGDTPLTLLSNLLDNKSYNEAKEIAELLIENGADPNHRNDCGWSILSYSLVHQDSSLNLTRSLLHHGSNVIPINDEKYSLDKTSSLPFRVLLRSVLRSQTVSNSRETFHILGQVMSCQNPAEMKQHVLSSIVAEGSLLTGNGPEICSQVRSMLMAYWSQPKPLLHLSLQASRKRLGLKRLATGNLTRMLIAPRLQHYLSYQSTLPLFYSQTQTTGTKKTDFKKKFSHLCHESISDKIRIQLQETPVYNKRF